MPSQPIKKSPHYVADVEKASYKVMSSECPPSQGIGIRGVTHGYYVLYVLILYFV